VHLDQDDKSRKRSRNYLWGFNYWNTRTVSISLVSMWKLMLVEECVRIKVNKKDCYFSCGYGTCVMSQTWVLGGTLYHPRVTRRSQPRGWRLGPRTHTQLKPQYRQKFCQNTVTNKCLMTDQGGRVGLTAKCANTSHLGGVLLRFYSWADGLSQRGPYSTEPRQSQNTSLFITMAHRRGQIKLELL